MSEISKSYLTYRFFCVVLATQGGQNLSSTVTYYLSASRAPNANCDRVRCVINAEAREKMGDALSEQQFPLQVLSHTCVFFASID